VGIIHNSFIIYVPSQQLQANYSTQNSVDTITLWTHKNTYIKSQTNYRQALEEKHINAGKQTNTQTNKDEG
jgi:hypothetical protein